jgi:hypothetical protein
MKRLLLFTLLAPLATLTQAQSFFGILPQNGCFNSNASMFNPTVVITATVPGATSYSWTLVSANCTPTMFTNPAGYGGLIASPCTGPYTLTGYAINGTSTITSSTYTGSINAATPLTITASPNNGVGCAGTTFTISNAGASGGTYTTTGSGIFGPGVGSTIAVTPTVTAVYTVVATAPSGCTLQAQKTISLISPPNVSVNNPNGCGNQWLNATGAQSYTWSSGATTPSFMVSAPTIACYTVVGSTNGCSGTSSAVACVTANAYPSITISGATVACLGSSFTFTASGANTYSWSNATGMPTLNVMPLTTTMYTVVGTSSSGCNGGAAVTASVNPNCAIVWPGDADRDGAVSSLDVLELGLAASSTGPSRSGASISWTGQYASAWNGLNSTGWNLAHVDCNGDGTVNSSDAAAITANFGLTHTFRETSGSSVDPDISLVPQQQFAYPNMWNKMDIMLGSSTNVQSALYGIAFEIQYDQNLLESDQAKIVYTSSFLNAGNQNIDFDKVVFAAGRDYAATVRTDHANVNGQGKIGEFWFRVKDAVADGTPIQVFAAGAHKVSANGNLVSATSGTASMAVSHNAAGLAKLATLMSAEVFPNPAVQSVTFVNDGPFVTQYSITDLTGREVRNGAFLGNTMVDVSTLGAGSYLVRFDSESGQQVRKLVIRD